MATWQNFEGLDNITDDYKYAVAENLVKNELGGVSDGYMLSHAGTGNSGWSFGAHQYDLSVNSDGRALIKDILDNEYGTQYYLNIEDDLTVARDSTSLSSETINEINQALSSDYGKEKINEDFIKAVNEITEHIDNVETRLNTELSDGEKLMLADYHNQYGLSLNSSSSAALINKMSDTLTANGDITKEDLKGFFEETKYYIDNPTTQGIRVDATYEAARQLDLNSIRASLDMKGLEDFETIVNEYINDFESNKEEKLENINNLFTQINSLDTTQDKLTLLSSTDLSSSFENNYCKQFISQYQDKVISNEGNSLSSTEIFSIQINPNFNLDSFNSQEEYKPSFAQSSQNNETNNSNSSIQAIG